MQEVLTVETLVVITSGSFSRIVSLRPAISILQHRGRTVLDDGHWMLRHFFPKARKKNNDSADCGPSWCFTPKEAKKLKGYPSLNNFVV